MNESPIFKYVRSIWPKKKPENLDINELKNLFRNANLKIESERIKPKFFSIDLNGDGYLDFLEIVNFIKDETNRIEIKYLYNILCKKQKSKESVLLNSLFKFIKEVQKPETVPSLRQTGNLIINYYKKTVMYGLEQKQEPGMYLQQFEHYMNGRLNSITATLTQKMNYPLSFYYISSSHNTYLKKSQLFGESSELMYEMVLKGGCKCIEIDCWDNGDEPVIYHGYTLTSKIGFRKAIESINRFAFVASEYPLILSLENHCSIKNQDKMVDYMKKIFAEKLELPEQVKKFRLASPQQLKNKIIIKAKKNKNVSQKLQDLSYLTGVKKTGPNNSVFSRNMASRNENDVGNDGGYVNYTKHNLMRIYPKATRIGSSNYNPIKAWANGNQIVALNWQTKKINLRINQAMFEAVGYQGYRLKPMYLLGGDTKKNEKTINLKIHIYSGRFLPKKGKDIISPVVRLSIIGSEKDVKKVSTHEIKNNGLSPLWNISFDFTLFEPDDDFLMFEVIDNSSDTLMCYHIVKVSDIQGGYRSVHLKTLKYKNAGVVPNLFCKIDIF